MVEILELKIMNYGYICKRQGLEPEKSQGEL